MGGKGCTRSVFPYSVQLCLIQQDHAGLVRLRDNLLAQLQELNRSKARGKVDENIIAEITRLESAITVTKDDLVREPTLCLWIEVLRGLRVLLNFAIMVQKMSSSMSSVS